MDFRRLRPTEPTQPPPDGSAPASTPSMATAAPDATPTAMQVPDMTVPGFDRIRSDEPIVGGVAARMAAALGADPMIVRVGFCVLASAVGFGFVLYGVVWLLTVDRPWPRSRPRSTGHDMGVIALTAAGLVWVAGLVSLPVPVVVAVTMVLFGLALSGELAGRALGSTITRVALGLLLVVAGMLVIDDGRVFAISRVDLIRLAIALAVIVAGLALMALPFVVRLATSARDDRRARIRAEERADVAAHLHDSVLQTLTLIQNRADDPIVIAALAHQQERELRQWLYGAGDGGDRPSTFRSALEAAAAEVEDQYLRVIECIVVGDCELSEPARAAVAAAREAMINAAKFADVPLISVYAEVGDDHLRCFVRDRGVGFDPAMVPSDRRGIIDSIEGRAERLGGSAVVRATPGSGTEVRIEVPR